VSEWRTLLCEKSFSTNGQQNYSSKTRREEDMNRVRFLMKAASRCPESVRARYPGLFLENPSDRRIIQLCPRERGRKILIIAGRKISPANPLDRLIARRSTKHIGSPVAFSHFSFHQPPVPVCFLSLYRNFSRNL